MTHSPLLNSFMEDGKYNMVFFGTHDFAVTILQSLIDNSNINVGLVITQPDRPIGRERELQKPPVKILAEKHGLTISQPESLKNYELGSKFDVGIVAQYGLLIPKNILEAPAKGLINIHTSLLPKYRGASPIQSALINGDTETGVTIMKMDEGLDSGPIIIQKTVTIDVDETYPQLSERMARTASKLLNNNIVQYLNGEIEPTDQKDDNASFCKQLTRDDGEVDWKKSGKKIYNLYRGLTPWPGIWTMWGDKRLKLLKIKKSFEELPSGKIKIEGDKIFVGAGDGSLEILELQLEGKRAMSCFEFLKGFRNIDSSILK